MQRTKHLPVNDELMPDIASAGLSTDQQQRLIRKHCTGIDERIRNARAADDARQLVDDTCRMFGKECASEVVRSFLERYVADLFSEHWMRR
jgi:hypothetical protein